MIDKIIVIAESAEFDEYAEKISEKLNAECRRSIPENCRDIVLKINEDGLNLASDGMMLRGDFTKSLPRLKKNNLNGEMLVKAAKIANQPMPITVLDATAGMGEDSLILAAYGFNVIMYERDPVIAALLRDTMDRAIKVPELKEIMERMELREGDSIEAMLKGEAKADIILLDPMFPERQKSGLVKKKFQLIHTLEKPCDDEEALLNAAIEAGPKRIIIKRPAKGPFLAGRKPSYSLDGKAIRYDCIVGNTTGKK